MMFTSWEMQIFDNVTPLLWSYLNVHAKLSKRFKSLHRQQKKIHGNGHIKDKNRIRYVEMKFLFKLFCMYLRFMLYKVILGRFEPL